MLSEKEIILNIEKAKSGDEKAKELLCNTNETIAAIGDRVGYKDSRYFSQTFTKQVGVKPVLYRKLHS